MLPSIFIQTFLKIKRQYFGLCFWEDDDPRMNSIAREIDKVSDSERINPCVISSDWFPVMTSMIPSASRLHHLERQSEKC
jgi:hypothetical protein